MDWRIAKTDDGESFHWDSFETKEEAIEFGKIEYKDEELEFFYVGLYKQFEDTICGVVLLENQSENALDNFMDCAEGYLEDCTKEHTQELEHKLTRVFREWQKKYNYEPNFGVIVKMEKVYFNK